MIARDKKGWTISDQISLGFSYGGGWMGFCLRVERSSTYMYCKVIIQGWFWLGGQVQKPQNITDTSQRLLPLYMLWVLDYTYS